MTFEEWMQGSGPATFECAFRDGNSLMQDSARHIASVALEAAAPKGEEG